MENKNLSPLSVVKRKPALDIYIEGNADIIIGKQPTFRAVKKDLKDKIWWGVKSYPYHIHDKGLDLAIVVDFFQHVHIRIEIETARKQTGTYRTYADVSISNYDYDYRDSFEYVLDTHHNEELFLFLNFSNETDFIKDFDYKRSDYIGLVSDQFDDHSTFEIAFKIVENAVKHLIETDEDDE